jgi:uncharacterized protein YggE
MQRTFVMAVFAVISSMVTLTGIPTIAQSNSPVLRTQGNPALGDFQTLSNKRADLRVSVSRKGRDAAFTDWLRTERPQLYRDALKQMTVQSQTAAKSSACCVKGASCCSPSSSCCGKSCCSSCGTTDCCK